MSKSGSAVPLYKKGYDEEKREKEMERSSTVDWNYKTHWEVIRQCIALFGSVG